MICVRIFLLFYKNIISFVYFFYKGYKYWFVVATDICVNRDDFNKVLYLFERVIFKFNYRVVFFWWSVIIYIVDYLLFRIKSFEECYGFYIFNWILDCFKFFFCVWFVVECFYNWYCFGNVFICFLNVFCYYFFKKILFVIFNF